MLKLLKNALSTVNLLASFALLFVMTPADCQEIVRAEYGALQQKLRGLWRKRPREDQKTVTAT